MDAHLDSVARLLQWLGQRTAERPLEHAVSMDSTRMAKSESLALSFYRGRGLVGRLTYGELLAQVEQVTGYLVGELGVGPGDRIVLLMPNRLEVPVLLLALWRIGAVAVPLNPTTPPEDWGYIARHSEARGAVVAVEFAERFAKAAPALEFALEVGGLFAASGAGALGALGTARTQRLAASGEDLAIVLYTSGTTGNPKGVGLSQRNLLRNGWSMALNFELAETTQFAVLPLYHAHALGFGLMTSLTTGGHLVFTDKLDPFAWSEVIRAESVTYTSVVPSLLPLLLAARVHQVKVPSLRAILVSSAPLTVSLAREFEDKTALPLIQGWGLSEYTNFACCLSPHLPESERGELLHGGELTSIGSPLTGTEVQVVDADGKAVGEEVSGELCVRGHSRMLTYYRDPDATRATMLGDWLRTGDQGLFKLHAGKPVFYITGRIKEIIIRSGEKYSPLAIEKKIVSVLPELEGKLVVLGFAHRGHGEEIGAYLEWVANSDAESSPSAEMRVDLPSELPGALPADLRARLATIFASLPIETRPKVLLWGERPIPRTHTGKIQRRKLQPLFADFVEFKGMLRILAIDGEIGKSESG